MDSATKNIEQFKEVLNATNGDLRDPVAYWARRAVITEALRNSAYLKRRVIELYPERGNTFNRFKLKRALEYLRDLKPVTEACAILRVV